MQITKTIKPFRTKPDCAKTPNGKRRNGQPFGMAGNIEGRRALTELLLEFQHNVKVRNSKKRNKPPNGLRYPLVGGTRRSRFDGTSFEPSVNLFWRRIPTSRVHALLGAGWLFLTKFKQKTQSITLCCLFFLPKINDFR